MRRTPAQSNRKHDQLTHVDLKNAAIGEELYDGDRLYITRMSESVYQSALRYTSPVTGKRRTPATSAFNSLARIRQWANPLRDMVDNGIDPLIAKQQRAAAEREALEVTKRAAESDANTLLVLARKYHHSIASTFRNKKHRAQWLASIEGSLAPDLLNKPIAAVTTSDLLDVLLPLRDRVPETARRVRQRLDAVFADAALRGLCTSNPAALIVRRMRVKRQGQQPHLRALHYRDVPTFVIALRESQRIGMSVKLAMEFAIHTASRSGEARGLRYSEIDRKAKLATLAAARMKTHEEHRVHLSPRVLEILAEVAALRTDRSDDALVFPAPTSRRVLSDMTLTQALRRLETRKLRDDGKPETYADFTTMHGLARTTFSTWANSERIAPTDVIEAALSHRETNLVKAAYDRSRKDGERFERDLRSLRLAWSTFVCTPRQGNVVAFKRKGA